MGKPRLPPKFLIALLIFVRLPSSFYNLIYDCDETYNYWEVAHYLIYNNGYLTWEYSPQYALRSFFYLWSYILPSFILSFITSNEVILFYFTRFTIACLGVFCELYFCVGLGRVAGAGAVKYCMIFLTMSSGMYFASTAFLPNTLSMHLTMVTFGAWFCDHYKGTIFAAGLSILLGWPYVAITYIPIGVCMLLNRKKVLYFIVLAIVQGIIIQIPMTLIDSYYYGKFVMASFNTIYYNVFSSHAGPELYGVESVFFYLINLLLNFNIVFLVSFLSLPCYILSKIFITTPKHKMLESSHLLCIVSMSLCLLVFSLQAHKEERFLYQIYPLICANTALTVKIIERFVVGPKRPYSSPVFKTCVYICCLAFLGLSCSRVISLHDGFKSTFQVMSDIKKFDKDVYEPILNTNMSVSDNALDSESGDEFINVCYGKEWYRYPSSFFLPDSRRYRLRFIRSSFRGLLPKLYEPNEANFKGLKTRIVYNDTNDMNREELSRYISPDKCHYLIDSSQMSPTKDEPDHSLNTVTWKTLSSYKMLDLANSPVLIRSFYLPFISARQNRYIDYKLLRNNKLFRDK